MNLCEDSITFGKYKDLTLQKMLRDRKYCEWLLKQEWFPKQYEYLYNRVKDHDPLKKFFKEDYKEENNFSSVTEFLEKYKYFNLKNSAELKLSENEIKCYKYYKSCIKKLRNKIILNIEEGEENPYNIKAPTSWLKDFEKKHNISRDILKEFLSASELPNITSIVEDIKTAGGIVYKGAKSFLIAKENSLKQEAYWEEKLKEKYGENIGTQFKFKNCIFDFICISSGTLYECKLGLKDFNEEQHKKYLLVLGEYSIIYLISTDCIIDIDKHTIYTTNPDYYEVYLYKIPEMTKPSKFDKMIQKFKVERISSVEEVL